MTKRKRRSIIILLIVLLVYVPVFFISVNLIREYSVFESYSPIGYDTSNPITNTISELKNLFGSEKASAKEEIKRQYDKLMDLLWEGYVESLSQGVNIITSRDVSSESPLDSYYIYIDEYNYNQLISNLPQSGFEEVDGYLKYNDGTMQEIKLRFRGANTWHWYFTQKSWRIKTEKDELINGARKINLVNPFEKSAMIDYLSFLLGQKMGVLSTDSIPVRVFVNNKYMGISINMAQTDEYFLRNNNKLPSEIYCGDLVWVDEEDKNQGYMEAQLWQTENIGVWEKMAENNNIASDDCTMLYNLIEFVEGNQKEPFSYEIENLIDIDKYLNWRACMNIVASFHTDNVHNQKLYWDPSSGKFEPILWDLDGFTFVDYQRPIYRSLNDLDKIILKNPEYADIMYSKLYEAITQIVTMTDMTEMVDDAYDLIKEDIYADIYKDYLIGSNFSRDFTNSDFDEAYEQMLEWVENRYEFINDTLSATEIKYTSSKTNEGDTLFNVEIDGTAGARIEIIELESQPENGLEIYRDINFNRVLDREDVAVSFTIEQNTVMLDDEKVYPVLLDLQYAQLENGTTPPADTVGSPEYTYIITGDVNITGICAVNNVTNGNVQCTETSEVYFADKSLYTTHPWEIQKEGQRNDIIFDTGEYIINEDIVINKNQQLVINEGAVLKLTEGVNIIVFGELKINGTDGMPVIITAYDRAHPWGVLALQGHYNADAVHEINGAYISYGGVPAQYDGAMYTGMVSAYNTTLKITDSKISYNCVGDDALNVKQGYLFADSCAFVNASSDAIDMDISEGVIQNCYFSGSGNDAIDLMTSSLTIQGNYIEKSGDKGISVGEKSNPVIYNNIIDSCTIGIEIKDLSEPVIQNCSITNNNIGINLYHKNDKYESGGRGSAEDTIIMANETPVDADDESYFTLENCLLDIYNENEGSNITFNNCTAASVYSVYYHEVQTGRYSGMGLTEQINAGDR